MGDWSGKAHESQQAGRLPHHADTGGVSHSDLSLSSWRKHGGTSLGEERDPDVRLGFTARQGGHQVGGFLDRW